MRHELWPLTVDIFDQKFSSEWNRSELGIYLPWQRTFEIRIEATVSNAADRTGVR